MYIEMNEKRIKEAIVNMYNSQEYLQLMRHYSNDSFFKTLKISRNELVHSNFLSWLFDPTSNHELKIFPIKKLLQTLSIVCEKTNNIEAFFPAEYKSDFLIENYNLSKNCSVQTEVCTGKISGYKKEGRIDLLIHLKFTDSDKTLPVIIENKVLSSENKNGNEKQTEMYYAWANEEYNDTKRFYPPLFIFLAPDFEKDIRCSCKEFIKVSYQNLVDYVIEPCLSIVSNSQSKFIIENYLRCLSNSTLKETDNGKENRIMAFSKNEKELLESFYTKNKDLFEAVFTMLASDDELTDEEREKIKMALPIAHGKDYTKYIFEGQIYSKSRCAFAIVKKIIDIKNISTYEELKEIFPDNLQGPNGVIKKVDEISDNAIKYKRYYIKDDEILKLDFDAAVCTQWGIDNFPNILKVAQQQGLIITKL